MTSPRSEGLLEAAAKAAYDRFFSYIGAPPWHDRSPAFQHEWRENQRVALAVIGERLADALEQHVYLDFRSAQIAGAAVRRLCALREEPEE